MGPALLAVGLGATLGAWLRWFVGAQLNARFPSLPPGTLLVNLVGGYLIGVAVAWFASHPEVPAHWRLFAITGFLGGLTTFSAFSAEVVERLSAGEVGWALATVALHVAGSVAMTLLGIASVALLRG